MSRWRMALAAVVVGVSACKRAGPPAPDAGLFADATRLQALAQKAVQPGEERELALAGTPRIDLIPGLSCEVTELKAVSAVRTSKLSLTSIDGFVMLKLKLQNALKQGVDVDLARFFLEHGDKSFPLARDAQAAAGTQPLQGSIAPGGEAALTLYFEIPAEELDGGLRLRLNAPRGDAGVVLDLQ